MRVLSHDLKNFVDDISSRELVHLDPVRVRIYIQGLIDSEERRMTDYKTGVIPNLIKDLNELLDLTNDIEPSSKLQHDDLFKLAKGISNVRDRIVKEFLA
jgi:hypothetical protein